MSDEESGDIVYEENRGTEVVKKLRARLRKCEREKKEYLDGWQRQRADALNAKRQRAEAVSEAKKRAVIDFLHELLPALDSFDMALTNDSWETVDAVWRTGIENVHTQLLNGLKAEGVSAYGAPGDVFDPQLHEAIGHLPAQAGTASEESGTIAQVERRGYKMGDVVVRAAHVIVFN
jgi:molecular chaperone GrpE